MELSSINGVGFKESGDGGTNATQTLADTFDTFLLLLTTQLQNQDPLEPMDSSQFTQQLAQFAGVEQSINTNSKLDQLVALQTTNQLNGAVGYIGKSVEVVTDQLLLKDGSAKITYGLGDNAASNVINIINEAGVAVRTINGETAAGRHELTWDGRDSSGNQLPDGVYGFIVAAADSEDQPVDVITASIGKVTGVEIVDNLVTLNIGALGAPFDAIFAVRDEEPGS